MRWHSITFSRLDSIGNCENIAKQGDGLRMAADNLERLTSTTGHRLGAAAHEAVRESRTVSGKLIEDGGNATDEVGKVFESLGKQVEAAGRSVEPTASYKSTSTQ